MAKQPGTGDCRELRRVECWIAPGPQPLGRPLSGGANVTVNLISPGTQFGPRRNNFDLRRRKDLKFGSKRLTISVDGYNLTNVDTVLAFNNSFVPGGAWLTPTRIATRGI